ncbi:MAG: Glycosyltransferase [Candidatus Ozemobacter sibiricus]|uniref:Glycosyltransferase n=1 Tax=Candidatus Ozemobacter sibiricus TaxID=2268124 RepID=A0A367ZR26_9BACT|nr:MAG: Glycosyltransferase [Candidatus Ozemobacter sibiricus]
MGEIAVSVVVPVYNNPEGLTACLEALAAQQTARSFEVVVVDDASTVDLEPIRTAFSPRLSLQWQRLPRNSGPAAARNAGIQAARGELVLFTDGDCRPEPLWLEALARPFDDPAVRGAKGVYRTAQTDRVARLAQLEFEERYDLLATFPDIDFVDTYSGAFRRADLLAVGGFDTSFRRADNEDVDLSFRIKARGGRFVFVPTAVVWHRHREGWAGYARLKFGRGFWRMKVYRKHPHKAGRDTYTPWTLKAQLGLLGLAPLLAMGSWLGWPGPGWRSRQQESALASAPGLRPLGKGMIGGGFAPPRRRSGLAAWVLSWFAAWLITCLPLMKVAWRRDRWLMPWVPVFLLVRGVALVAGMLAGIGSGLLEPWPARSGKANQQEVAQVRG